MSQSFNPWEETLVKKKMYKCISLHIIIIISASQTHFSNI